MDSATLGGSIRQIVRSYIKPACREGRVSRLRESGLLEVTVRSLTGDLRTLPARGYCARVVDDGMGGLTLLDAVKGDPVWVAEDEGSQFIVLTWEPKT